MYLYLLQYRSLSSRKLQLNPVLHVDIHPEYRKTFAISSRHSHDYKIKMLLIPYKVLLY